MGKRVLSFKNNTLAALSGALSGAVTCALAVLSVTPVVAQPVGPSADAVVCQRHVQANERLQRIPQGLLAAISLVESGRGVGAGGARVAWPWTINAGGEGQYFDSKEEAVAATRALIEDGLRSIDVGCMQVNLRYHPDAFASLEDAFEPAKNVAYGASYLRQLHRLQGSWPKAVERYHSSDDGRRADYRDKVLTTWREDARSLIMNAVLAEDTDTPYHRAVKDFAAGRYSEALQKYQAILRDKENDRLALLGIAMTSERLGRTPEAEAAYDQFLINEPENDAILTRVLESTVAMPIGDATARLERLANSGVDQPAVLAMLADLKGKMGQDDSALSYMGAAIQRAPDIAVYHLNAGVLADRLKRPTQAVAYYSEFIRLFELQPIFIETSVDGVRDRARYLRAQM